MKKSFINIAILLAFSSPLSALCVYVDCSGSVSAATTQSQQEMQTEFTAIQAQLNTLEENYKKQAKALEKNNGLYEKNKLLKAEYLILLKKINHKLENLKRISAVEQKPNAVEQGE